MRNFKQTPDMDAIEILGLAAATLITIANIPQFVKIVRTKSVGDISWFTYALLTAGNICWLVYGIFRADLPIVLGNSVSTLLCGFILFYKIRFGEKSGKK